MYRITWDSLILILLLIGAAFYITCDDSSIVKQANNPPVIEGILANPETMSINTLCTLQVDASDADGDNLTYQWSAEQGNFTSGTEDTVAIWQAPGVPGACIITVAVSDEDSTVKGSKVLNVIVPARLNITPASLIFEAETDTQFVIFEYTGSDTLTYHLDKTADWLILSKDSGVLVAQCREEKAAKLYISSEQITVSVKREGLEQGAYLDIITVTSNGGTEQIDVIMYVSDIPILSVSEKNLNFSKDQTQMTFDVANKGQGILNWQAAASEAWITGVTPGNGDCGAGETDQVSVTVDRSGLGTGTYSGMVVVTSDAGSDTVNLQMVDEVAPEPVLSFRPQSIDLGSSRLEDTIEITNSGGGTLNWHIENTESWMTFSPASGSLTTDTAEVVLRVDRSGLVEGTYTDVAHILSDGGNSDLVVCMKVTAHTLDEDFSSDLSDWRTQYADAWIENSEAHVIGNIRGIFGTLIYDFLWPVTAEYNIRIKMASAGSDNISNQYGLWIQTADTGNVTISQLMFCIRPFDYTYNYLIMVYIYGDYPDGSGWYCIDSKSLGYLPYIKMGLNEWNELTWQVKEDGRINLSINDVLFYNTDLVTWLKNNLGIHMETEILAVGLRTNYEFEAKMDEISVESKSIISSSVRRSSGPWLAFPDENTADPIPPLPDDFSQIKCLTDFVNKKQQK